MPGPAAILKDLHHLRRHAKELQNQINRGPTVLKNQQAKLVKQEQALHDAQENLKKLKVSVHEKEVTLKATTQQIDKHKLQMNSASSKKEYDAFKNEIASDQQKCKQLEDEILTAMLEVDERAGKIPELERAVHKAKEDLAEFEKKQQVRLGELAAELTKAQGELKTVEDSLHHDIRPVYDRLMSAMGEDAMSSVQGRTCTACYTEITAQAYNDLVTGQFVFCKTCGRILYLAE